MALVAQRRLVGQAVATALASKRLVSVPVPWPRRGELQSFVVGVARSRASVGVVLCDLGTPDVLHDVETIVKHGRLRWLVLTDSAPDPRWGTVLEAGALAVLPTTTSTSGLALAVREALRGGTPMPPSVRDRAIQEWHDVAEEQRALVRDMERLTHREFQVLGQLYDGKSVSRIAATSGASVETVRTQVKSIRRKLGADSQLAAVAMYRRALAVFPRARD